MAFLLGCTPQKMASMSDEPPVQAKRDDVSELSLDRAALAYLTGPTAPWSRLLAVSRQSAPEPPVKPKPVTAQHRSAALAKTLQKELEVDPRVASKVAPLIEKSAHKYNVPPSLIAAVVNRETDFDNKKRSSAGAIGLAQIMPNIWGKECKGNLWQDSVNIDCSAKILSHYYELAGDWEQALAFYNVGPGKYQRSPTARVVGHRYASSVMTSMSKIKEGRAMVLASIEQQR